MNTCRSKVFDIIVGAGLCLLLAPAAGADPVGKVDICHMPGAKAQRILNVDPASVASHEAHGDYLVEAEVCDGLDQDCEIPPVADNDVDCSDGIACTVDSCAGAPGCFNVPDDTLCDDNDPGTLDECSVTAGGCVNTPFCGNGTIESPEECDDGNTTDGDGCSSTCEIEAPPTLTVFVTSGSYTGNLVAAANSLTGYTGTDGLDAGDAICNHLAGNAGLSGTYRAWLSTSAANDPESTFTQGTVPYVLTNGTQVASSWATLVTAALAARINVNESQGPAAGVNVWSATSPTGTSDHINGTCTGWTSSSTSLTSRGGQTGFTDSRWTQWVAFACSSLNRLYCFEQ